MGTPLVTNRWDSFSSCLGSQKFRAIQSQIVELFGQSGQSRQWRRPMTDHAIRPMLYSSSVGLRLKSCTEHISDVNDIPLNS